MTPGDTFLIPSAYNKPHLHVVLAVRADGAIIYTNLTSRSHFTDETCIIEPGEHPFVVRQTTVCYNRLAECPAENVGSLERSIVKWYDRLSDNLLKRILQGALDSDQTIDKYKELIATELDKSGS